MTLGTRRQPVAAEDSSMIACRAPGSDCGDPGSLAPPGTRVLGPQADTVWGLCHAEWLGWKAWRCQGHARSPLLMGQAESQARGLGECGTFAALPAV